MTAKVLVVAEHRGGRLAESTAKCVACALELEPESLDVVVFTADADELAAEAARIRGVTRVLEARDAAHEGLLAAVLAPRLAELAGRGYTHVLAPSTTFGKDLLPRAAALLGVGQLSDIMAVEGPRRFKRPTYAGNAIVTVEAAPDRLLVGTVRIASYRPAEPSDRPAPIEPWTSSVAPPGHTRYVRLDATRTGRPDLQTATKVVAGGRALGSAERFELVGRLADALGAAIGASRAAVDAGYAPNDLQVGQTGKVIAPDLYIALGISGAIQHLTGIKDAGTIVAINKDPEAPIFEVADLGLVADLFEAVPAMIDALEKRAGRGV
ncbi:MAG TPA: electron transfer flavoprotein subunit alpha/FixB family protein [Gammaproteobacteria bacterium]